MDYNEGWGRWGDNGGVEIEMKSVSKKSFTSGIGF